MTMQLPLLGQSVASAQPQSYDLMVWPYPVPYEDVLIHLVWDQEPLSKQRPRFGKNGSVYTPAQTKNYELALGFLLLSKLDGAEPDRTNCFGLRCVFYRSTRHRIDCDNMLKAVSDAANGRVWKDDNQVIEVIGRLFLASDNPRSEILIYRLPTPFPRQKCLFCEKEFVTYPSQEGKFCSLECHSNSKRVTRTCGECGKSFVVPQSFVKHKVAQYCSRKCSLKHFRDIRITGRESEHWKCIDCGQRVSRKEYKRCRACSMKHRQDPTSNYWKLRQEKSED